MAAPLKDFFSAEVVRAVADELSAAHRPFPRAAFVRDATRGLQALELMDRGRHVMRAMRAHLPDDPAEAIGILERSLGPPLDATGPREAAGEGHGMAPFRYLPHVLFVAEHGLPCFEASMRAQHALTQRFTAEFSVRRFLEAEPARTLARLEAWTRDPSPHVRRLVSEGTRPRLPWAGRLRAFQRDPSPTLALLERLKDDPHPYVRRSVANHLNDIGKDHPALLVEVATRWLRGASPERRRLVEHGLRTAIKRGDPAALRALGFRAAPDVEVVRATVTPAAPRIGGAVRIDVEVRNGAARAADVVVDLGVHFVKADGGAKPKVFKLRAVRLPPGGSVVLGRRIALAQLSTRTHRPGHHAVDVRLNGRVVPAGGFTLRA
ncbi:MAG: DNA alkylation repair protein [Planctomycetota bacterium]